jgi:Domain of unknown function (DUF4214)
MPAKPRFTPSFKLLSATALMCLAAVSAPAQAQSRTCIIDEVNGQHRCGYLADEQGYRIADRPAPVVVVPAPVVVPNYGNDRPNYGPNGRYENRPNRDQRDQQRDGREQQRMEVQEWVNSLFLDVLGRDADIVTLRKVTEQVMAGRAPADVRIELATSTEARTAINQIYRDVLRREADPSGLNSQLAALRGGLTLAQIRQAISESPEARNRR